MNSWHEEGSPPFHNGDNHSLKSNCFSALKCQSGPRRGFLPSTFLTYGWAGDPLQVLKKHRICSCGTVGMRGGGEGRTRPPLVEINRCQMFLKIYTETTSFGCSVCQIHEAFHLLVGSLENGYYSHDTLQYNTLIHDN